MPAVSVVVPTTRATLLPGLLESLARQRTKAAFEVLVVENGAPRAATRDHVAEHQRSSPAAVTFHYHFIETQNANAARNHGIAAARSDRIAVTDDDCLVARDWIARLLHRHEQFPQAGAIGGRVRLDFLEPPPRWLVGPFRSMLAEIDWPPEPPLARTGAVDLSGVNDRYLCSANLSFRKALFDETGGFVDVTDVRPGQGSRNDERLFLDRLEESGSPGLVYDPALEVRHRIPPERTTIEYLEQKFRDQALSDYGYKRRARPHAGVDPPFRSEREALYNTILQHELCTDAIARPIREARAAISDEPVTRQFIAHWLRCKVAYIQTLEACLEADGGLGG